jgi:hypothetical protein
MDMTQAEMGRDWSERLDRLDRHPASGLLSPDVTTVAALMQTYRVPGLSIAVGSADGLFRGVGGHDGPVWAAGFGTTGAPRSNPVDVDTAFQACSISKHVAAFEAASPDDVTGRYLLLDNLSIDIGSVDGRLTFATAGQPSAVLRPGPGGHYQHPGLDLDITFQHSAGQPVTMDLRQEGVTQTATRSVTGSP